MIFSNTCDLFINDVRQSITEENLIGIWVQQNYEKDEDIDEPHFIVYRFDNYNDPSDILNKFTIQFSDNSECAYLLSHTNSFETYECTWRLFQVNSEFELELRFPRITENFIIRKFNEEKLVLEYEPLPPVPSL